MSDGDESIQTQCLKDILENYPETVISRVLEKMQGHAFEKDTCFTQLTLKKIWKDPKLTEEFMNIFDEYASYGRVHIFFYRLDEQKEYVQLLKDEEKLKEILPGKVRDLINKKVFMWDSKRPKLAEIRHHSHNGRGELMFKWIESRVWHERVSGISALSPPKYVRREERSANYFVINLKEGTAQLRIQLIKPNALKSLKIEYEIYQKEIENLIDFKKFRRIALESVVRKLLLSREIKNLKSWELWLPGGGWIHGKDKLKRYKIIGLGMKILRLKLFGRKLFCEWEIKNRDWGESHIETKVNGEKDILTILGPCECTQMKYIVGKIMGIGKNKVIDRNLKKFVKKMEDNPWLGRIVLSFDYHLNQLKKGEVTAGHLIDSEWFQKDRVVFAIRSLCDNFPKVYDCKGGGKKLALFKR